MDLKPYLQSLGSDERRRSFAERCGTTLGNMMQVCYVDGRRLQPAVCVRVERESDGLVRRWELRTDWADIWPELIGTPGAPRIRKSRAVARAA